MGFQEKKICIVYKFAIYRRITSFLLHWNKICTILPLLNYHRIYCQIFLFPGGKKIYSLQWRKLREETCPSSHACFINPSVLTTDWNWTMSKNLSPLLSCQHVQENDMEPNPGTQPPWIMHLYSFFMAVQIKSQPCWWWLWLMQPSQIPRVPTSFRFHNHRGCCVARV